ncbi:MAG: hypothetical protein IPG72_16205 [Ardenticatenales bacterium]|nr:hypothetical protein [Ardenticatenales bacterium]
MVHGYGGGPGGTEHSCENPRRRSSTEDPKSDEFGFVAKAFADAGYDVWFAYYTTSYLSTPSLEVNARCLHNQIAYILKRLDATRVTLVAHSMGGLVSRAYIEGSEFERPMDVERLITLGTPHKGIPNFILDGLVVFLKGSFWFLPNFATKDCTSLATYGPCQMRESYVTHFFNKSHSPRTDLRYDLVGGDADEPVSKAAFSGAQNDGLVSVESASRVLSGSLIHNWVTTASHFDWRVFKTPSYFTEGPPYRCMKALSAPQKNGGDGCNLISPTLSVSHKLLSTMQTPARGPRGVVSLPIRYGTSYAGDLVTLPFIIDGTDATLIVQMDRDCNFEWKLPGGQSVDASTLGTILPGAQYTWESVNGTFVAAYKIPNPPPGEWHAIIRDVGSDLHYIVTGQLTTAVALSLDDLSAGSPGGDVAVRALLTASGAPIVDAEVTAMLIDDRTESQARLRSNGDGVYSGIINAPPTPGIYYVRIIARGRYDGVQFERESEVSLLVMDPRSAVTGSALRRGTGCQW